MVRDKKASRKRIRRRSSWKDTVRNQSETDGASTSRGQSPTAHRSSHKDMPSVVGVADEGSLGDAESEDEDFGKYKEEDRPLEARILYRSSEHIPRTGSVLEKQQEQLSIAIAEANSKAVKAVAGKSPANGSMREAIGTRLTMTSRTGYFQDRILSPTMVRPMSLILCHISDCPLDALHGDLVHWSSPQSRFCDGLSYFPHPGTESPSCGVPTSTYAVWGERSICRRHSHLCRQGSRSEASAQGRTGSRTVWKECTVWRELAYELARPPAQQEYH